MNRPDLVQRYTINQSFHWFISGLFFPVMVLFMLDKGLNIFDIGVMLGLYSGTVILLELPTGGLADSIGRKRTYLISQSIYLISLAVFLLSWGIVTIAIGIVIMGIARSLSSGSIDAWFVDEFKAQRPGEDLQKALAKANIFIPLGIAVGSLLGGLIPQFWGDFSQSALGLGRYGMNLLLMMLAVVIQIMLTQYLIQEHHQVGKGAALEGMKKLPEVLSTAVQYGLKDWIILLLLLSNICIGFSLFGVETYWQPRLSSILGGDSQTWLFGVLAAGYFLAGSIGNLVSIPLCARAGGRYAGALFGMRVMLGLSLIIFALQETLLGFAVLYLIFFLFVGAETSPYAALFNHRVPNERRSTLLSFQSLVLQLGGLLGTVGLAFVAQGAGIGTAWVVAGAVLSISSVFFLAAHLRPGSPLQA
jgi:MFS transporter, DHA1 family, quinolone resistance protein